MSDQAHLAVDRGHEAVHGTARIGLLSLGVGKQLEGLDIGVAVNDAAGHMGPRIGLSHRDVLEPWHENAHQHQIAAQPQHQRSHQPGLAAPYQYQSAGEIDHHIDEDVHQLDHRLADGECGLHDLLRDSSGEFVLKERQALLEQVAMGQPAHPHRVIAKQALVGDQRLAEHQ